LIIAFGPNSPFTCEKALDYVGKMVRVKVLDSGLTAIYYGKLQLSSQYSIMVGEDEIYNDSITNIWISEPKI
jgi:hypothetical protein